MKVSKRNISLIIALVIFFITVFHRYIYPKNQPAQSKNSTNAIPISSLSAELITVKRVVDGDTIELENGQKIRYIGMDTPELHHPKKPVQCFGQEAMIKNKELVEGKKVRLEKDVSETDKYKRLLRYVYLPTEASPSGIFVNDYLVKEGYAYAATFPPDVKYADLFVSSQNEAREKNKGLWSRCR